MVCLVQLRHSTIHYLCIKSTALAYSNEQTRYRCVERKVFSLCMVVIEVFGQVSSNIAIIIIIIAMYFVPYMCLCWECVCIINRNRIETALFFSSLMPCALYFRSINSEYSGGLLYEYKNPLFAMLGDNKKGSSAVKSYSLSAIHSTIFERYEK